MVVTPAGSVGERVLIEDARGGEGHAFGRLVEPYRPELHAHCYRLLGSVHDADDALQDALVRAWQGLPGFDHHRPLRPWLYKIATNVCLDLIAQRPRHWLPADHGSPGGDRPERPPASWVEPYPDEQLGLPGGYASPEARYEQREAVELAFVAALQHLPAQQRAVLILRDVLGFSARDAAEVLDTTPASVHSARRTIRARCPGQSQQQAMRSLGDRRLRELAQRLAEPAGSWPWPPTSSTRSGTATCRSPWTCCPGEGPASAPSPRSAPPRCSPLWSPGQASAITGCLSLAGRRTGRLPGPLTAVGLAAAVAGALSPLSLVIKPAVWLIPAGRMTGLVVTGVAGVLLSRQGRADRESS